MEPAGKCAVVTGGNSGLGRATAQWLEAVGADVISLDLSGEAPEGVRFIACDVSDFAAVEAAVAAIEGPIHILANCAGIGGIGPIATAEGPGDMAAFRHVVEVNLLGAAHATAAVATRMIGNAPEGEDGERGVIINACSIASFEGQEGMGAYTASKAGLAGLTLVWARDLSRHGIRVNGIAPGFMATPMVAMLPDDFVAELLGDAEFPKRAGRPDEFAEVVDFVIHTPLLNGEVIRLDAATRPPARTKWSMD
ncbi:3-hydroxyacyl-CoA dehydrogenase [Altererythrobacter sp. B11]|uniref:SDR family NAD(P)-dependent oxidoreductase n=1 Tax=Altererythrobacter sp. B11 TaxID=2060312 RepID=UPI000DC6FEA0|nr:SDR family NAD(P)-dependent oxidoreductase [Altererythrobacter sp. B11]BBC71932.1 3-hydroxyacyl-CoA dehydrogenase [Altererythrobacter sp. B11]